jgi:rare lipoprotein A
VICVPSVRLCLSASLIAALAACSSRTANGPSTTRLAAADRAGERQIDPRYGTSPSPRTVADGASVPKGGGSYKLGSPYKIAGRWYTPSEDPNYDRTGLASWYGTDFHGRKTANGELFDMGALTAAHPTLPIPSYAYVTNLDNNRTILVRINDRGPYAHNRIMDLSRRSAQALGTEGKGIGNVRVRYAGRAPLNGDDSHERRYLASQPWSQQLAAASTAPRAPWRTNRMALGRIDGVDLDPSDPTGNTAEDTSR